MSAATSGALGQLKGAFKEIHAIEHAVFVLNWDQLTYMPPGGAGARAEQSAVLQGLRHGKLTDPKLGELIEEARRAVADDPSSEDADLVRVAAREHGRATKVPQELVMAIARSTALAYPAWMEARAKSDFSIFAPWLQKTIEHSRRMAEHLGYAEHPFDALIDLGEPGMTTSMLRGIFGSLRPDLVDLVRRIAPQVASVNDDVLHRTYDEAAQERFGREVVTAFGYDFKRGRLDRTAHPFCIAFGHGDVRITTRYDPSFLPTSLMGIMHEAGHGLYEQGIATPLEGTPLDGGVSSGVHESQSRLWENYLGRSRPFWQHYYPRLQAAFPGVLDGVSLERFYRAINKVQPSLIRVEADEVTYNLHIILRFELEIALFEGSLRVEDAPEAWNAAMQDYLGITPATDSEGILQDVHWIESLAAFQGYALGNIIAAQLWEAILTAQPDLPEQIARGEFGALLGWLRENVHRHGRRLDPPALMERATGKPLSTGPYIEYLRGKFSGIYAGIN